MKLPGLDASACWLCATAAQEVQVWPLSAPLVPDQRGGDAASDDAAAAAPPPLAQLQLERFDALISLPTEMQPLGWRCLAVFCPYHPQLVAACGVTQRKQVPSRALIAPEPRAPRRAPRAPRRAPRAARLAPRASRLAPRPKPSP